MYLDYAENQAARHVAMRMTDWVGKMDAFLQFNEYEVIANAGKISHDVAKSLAEQQYDNFPSCRIAAWRAILSALPNRILVGRKDQDTSRQKSERLALGFQSHVSRGSSLWAFRKTRNELPCIQERASCVSERGLASSISDPAACAQAHHRAQAVSGLSSKPRTCSTLT